MTVRRATVPKISVHTICSAMEEWAPLRLASEWDKAGLSIGDPDKQVSRISVMLSVTPETLSAALRTKADLIVSHHPVIWEPLTHLCETDKHTQMCLQLVRANVACYAAHTNLDIAPGGVNDTLASSLGLIHCSPLFPQKPEPTCRSDTLKITTFVPSAHLITVRDAICSAGAGIVGDYSHCTFTAPGKGTFLPGDKTHPYVGRRGFLHEELEYRLETIVPSERIVEVLNVLRAAHPYEEPAIDIIPLETLPPPTSLGLRGELPQKMSLDAFARHVRTALGLNHVRIIGNGRHAVKRVAVLGGAGGKEVGDLPSDVEVYVTGDIGYHDALLLRERGIAAVDAGHAGTEQCIIPVVARFLKQRFKSLRITAHTEPETFQVIDD